MKTRIFNSNKEIEFPSQFREPYHPDLIKRAVHSLQSFSRTIYGSFSEAGKRQSAKLSRRRRAYKGSYGLGISRVPRKILSRRGTRFFWVGANAPGTVSGRRAHPPKSTKIFALKINKKERKKAIRSALSATLNLDLLRKRNHRFNSYPLVIDGGFEKENKTNKVEEFLMNLGLKEELLRVSHIKIRSGKGKLRSRRYKRRKGPLIVVSENCPLIKSASNIPGVDVVIVNKLNAEHLAPGADAGRLTIYTDTALIKMHQEGLFL